MRIKIAHSSNPSSKFLLKITNTLSLEELKKLIQTKLSLTQPILHLYYVDPKNPHDKAEILDVSDIEDGDFILADTIKKHSVVDKYLLSNDSKKQKIIKNLFNKYDKDKNGYLLKRLFIG